MVGHFFVITYDTSLLEVHEFFFPGFEPFFKSNHGTAIRSAVGTVIDKSLTAKIICILSTHVFSKEWYHFSYHVHGSLQGKELISGSLLFWTLREIQTEQFFYGDYNS